DRSPSQLYVPRSRLHVVSVAGRGGAQLDGKCHAGTNEVAQRPTATGGDGGATFERLRELLYRPEPPTVADGRADICRRRVSRRVSGDRSRLSRPSGKTGIRFRCPTGRRPGRDRDERRGRA